MSVSGNRIMVEDDGGQPVLHLSGPRLTRSFDTLIEKSEGQGGTERYIAGLQFKMSVFQEAFSQKRIAALDEKSFLGLCAFMAPVRRRIGPWVGQEAARQRERGAQDVLLHLVAKLNPARTLGE